MQYESFLDLVKTRRTIRRFMSDPIPDEYVDKIIETARWAPSGFNQQPWEFVIVKQAELKKQIADLCRESLVRSVKMESGREEWQGKMSYPAPPTNAKGGDFSVAPVYIVLFGDPRSKAGLPMSVRCEGAHLQSTFTSSLACCFLYMQLAATTLGLNSQWFTSVQTSYVHCMIKNLLGVPQELEIYDMLVIGFPPEDLKTGPKTMRDKSEMVHYDRSGPESFRSDAQVKAQIRKWRGV